MNPWIIPGWLSVFAGISMVLLHAATPPQQPRLTASDIMAWPAQPGDFRLSYGTDALQFGDLRLPPGEGPFPVVVVIHGGCWLAEYNLDHIGRLCTALTREGWATWSIEYRRIGDEGGGWPGTFQDVSLAVDYLKAAAKAHPLDLDRIIVTGHSAGGHLALWVAARKNLPADSPLFTENPLSIHGVVPLAGIPDLAAFRGLCGDASTRLMGGPPEKYGKRYSQAAPVALLPLGVPQIIITGDRDQVVPPDEQARAYFRQAQAAGDDVRLEEIPGAGHFELIDPESTAWPVIRHAIESLIRSGSSTSPGTGR